MMHRKAHLQGFITFTYSLFPAGGQIVTVFMLSYLGLFHTDKLGIAPAVAAVMMAVIKIGGAFFDLVFGRIMDRVSLPGGFALPWLRIAAIILPAGSLALFADFGLQGWLLIGVCSLLWLLTECALSLVSLPFAPLASRLADSVARRDELLAVSNIGSIAGAVIAALAAAPLISRAGFFPAALLAAVLAVLTMLPLVLTARESAALHAGKQPSAAGLGMTFRILSGNRQLVSILVVYLLLTACNYMTVIGPYFVKWNLGSLELMTPIMAATLGPVALIPLILPLLLKRFGKFRLMVFSLVSASIFSAAQFLAGYEYFPVFLLLNSLKVACFFIPSFMGRIFMADCCNPGSGVDLQAEGVVFALGSLSMKIGAALAGSMVLMPLSFLGYNPTLPSQPAPVLSGIWFLMSIAPVLGTLPALLIFILGYLPEDRGSDIKTGDTMPVLEDSYEQ